MVMLPIPPPMKFESDSSDSKQMNTNFKIGFNESIPMKLDE